MSEKLKLVRCGVCGCLVPKNQCVRVYQEPVCEDCDREMREEEEARHDREEAWEVDQVWRQGWYE